MVERKTMGIILANMHDYMVGSMTSIRSLASVPFAGRYRLIDFHLSNLVHAGIGDVAIIAKENYNSLMRHIGSGKEWDLSRKIDGVQLYPPHVDPSYTTYSSGKINAIHNILPHIKESSSRYAILLDCDHVANVDFSRFTNEHIASGADVSILCYEPDELDSKIIERNVAFIHDKENRVKQIAYHDAIHNVVGNDVNNVVDNNVWDKDFRLSMNVMILSRDLLIELIEAAHDKGSSIFERDILIPNIERLYIRSVQYTGYVRRIDSIAGYFRASMSLLEPENYNALFLKERPIYTKVNDDAPTRYGLDSKINNSLIADGCVIEGTVENSILFRGVTVEAGAVVRNSILMQSSIVKKDAAVNFVISDTYVKVTEGQSVMGYESHPLYISSRNVV